MHRISERYAECRRDLKKHLDELERIVSQFDQLDARKKHTFLRECGARVAPSQTLLTHDPQSAYTPPLVTALALLLQALLTPQVYGHVVRAQLDMLIADRNKALKAGRVYRAQWIVIRDCGWLVWSLVKWPWLALFEFIGRVLRG